MMPSQSTPGQRPANMLSAVNFSNAQASHAQTHTQTSFDSNAYALEGQSLEQSAQTATNLAQTLAAVALNELATGMIIIDQYARVLHRNPAAAAVLARGDCVAIDSGHITVTHMPDVRKFSQALTLAAAGQRSMIALGAQSHITVAVVPLQSAPNHSGHNAQTAVSPTEHFALILSRPNMCEALMLGSFARAYQLTPTEERVLGLVGLGLTVPEMAKKLQLGPATIRTHVRNICAKTGCHGLREIVTRLAVMPALKVKIA